MKIITDKKAKQIIELIADNYIAALSCLKVVEYEDRKHFLTSVETIQSLTIETARLVGGIKGVEQIDSIISKFHRELFDDGTGEC